MTTTAIRSGTPKHPPTIDPSDVEVGDVVEVEADDGTWMVRGEVAGSDSTYSPPRVLLHVATTDPCWVYTAKTTVRLVHRAEPEPDPEQVKKLAELLERIDAGLDMHNVVSPENYARELVRRGVTVGKRPLGYEVTIDNITRLLHPSDVRIVYTVGGAS